MAQQDCLAGGRRRKPAPYLPRRRAPVHSSMGLARCLPAPAMGQAGKRRASALVMRDRRFPTAHAGQLFRQTSQSGRPDRKDEQRRRCAERADKTPDVLPKPEDIRPANPMNTHGEPERGVYGPVGRRSKWIADCRTPSVTDMVRVAHWLSAEGAMAIAGPA